MTSAVEVSFAVRSSPVDPASDRAFVRKNTRYSAFVFGGCASDERRVVNYAILWGVALCLERSEEGLKMRKHEDRCFSPGCTVILVWQTQQLLKTQERATGGHTYVRTGRHHDRHVHARTFSAPKI